MENWNAFRSIIIMRHGLPFFSHNFIIKCLFVYHLIHSSLVSFISHFRSFECPAVPEYRFDIMLSFNISNVQCPRTYQIANKKYNFSPQQQFKHNMWNILFIMRVQYCCTMTTASASASATSFYNYSKWLGNMKQAMIGQCCMSYEKTWNQMKIAH